MENDNRLLADGKHAEWRNAGSFMAAAWKGGSLNHIICVDDEQLALDNFRLAVENMHGVETLQLF